jgi:hypothetical protein
MTSVDTLVLIGGSRIGKKDNNSNLIYSEEKIDVKKSLDLQTSSLSNIKMVSIYHNKHAGMRPLLSQNITNN